MLQKVFMITPYESLIMTPPTGEYYPWSSYAAELKPPETYLEQPEVMDIIRWRQEIARTIGALGCGAEVSCFIPWLVYEHERIQSEMKEVGYAIGEHVLKMLCNSPFEANVLELAGRTKEISSILGKVKRRENAASTDRISDLYAFLVRTPNDVLPRRVLEHACCEFEGGEINPLANGASDPRFVRQGILQAKLHTTVDSRQVPFELIVLTRHQSKVYNKTRHNFVSTRERDQEALQLMDTLNRMLPS